jgi:hypothetical protein
MLACRTIGPERVCSGPQLINVNATAKAKFVDWAKSVALSGIFADDQLACGINRRRSSGDSAAGPDVMVAVLPGSDDEVVIPWQRHISL